MSSRMREAMRRKREREREEATPSADMERHREKRKPKGEAEGIVLNTSAEEMYLSVCGKRRSLLPSVKGK